MEEFKERQAKMAGVQSALQSGDLASGYVGLGGVTTVTSSNLTHILQILSVVDWGRRRAQGGHLGHVEGLRLFGCEATHGQEQEAVGLARSFSDVGIDACYHYTYSSITLLSI